MTQQIVFDCKPGSAYFIESANKHAKTMFLPRPYTDLTDRQAVELILKAQHPDPGKKISLVYIELRLGVHHVLWDNVSKSFSAPPTMT